MFYCDECAKKNKYPESFSKSKGKCELCGEEKICNDVPCSALPDSPVNKVALNKQQECLKALNCLYLAVDKSIADDVKEKVLAALEEAKSEGMVSSSKPKYLSFCTYENYCFHKYLNEDNFYVCNNSIDSCKYLMP